MDTLNHTSRTFGLVVENEHLGFFIWNHHRELIKHVWQSCNHYETRNLVIFNPTKIAKFIRDFLSSSNIVDYRGIIALNAPGLDENLVYEYEGLNTQDSTQHPNSSVSQMHQLTKNCWYKVSLPYALRAQYQLLSLMVPLQRVRITTVTLAYCTQLSLEQKVIPEAAYSSLTILKESLRAASTSTQTPAYAQGLCTLAQE